MKTRPDDPRPWQVVQTRYLEREPWLTLREDRVRLPSGAEIARYWVNEFTPWVNVVARTAARELVLVRQYRHGLGLVHDELPAGTAEHGEDPLVAAGRELLEETGYGGGSWSEILRISANPALQNNWTHCFLADGVQRVGDPKPEATEDLRVHLVPEGDVLRMIDAGEIVQALHVAPLLRVLLGR